MPPDLADILANDPYSQDRFDALPECTQDHLETLFPDPAEAAALFRMLRLHKVSESMGYTMSCGQSLQYQWPPYPNHDTAKKHGLMLAEISQLEQTFPHLDFDHLVTCVQRSCAAHWSYVTNHPQPDRRRCHTQNALARHRHG